MDEKARVEEFEVRGDEVIAKVKELVQVGGNIRRISLKDKDGNTLIEVPLTIGVAGAVAKVPGAVAGVLVPPVLAAIGAIAALVARVRIVVERVE